MGNLVSILVPAFNERRFLEEAVRRLAHASLPGGVEREIIVVDDGSTDGTAEVAARLAAALPRLVRFVRLEANQGKGAALRRAIREMRGDLAVVQDADLEYDPADLPALLNPILDGRADVVYGSRFLPGGERRAIYFTHTLGNTFITFLSNLCTNLNLTDVETGAKAFRASLLRSIPIRSNRFGFEVEITAKVARRGARVYETPIRYHGRSYVDGKKIRWTDGLAALGVILWNRLVDDSTPPPSAAGGKGRAGEEALRTLARARRFNAWMAERVAPFLGERILEIGAGIGTLSAFLPRRGLLLVSDIEERYISFLADEFRHAPGVEVARVDLLSDADFAGLAARRLDTAVCLNVLEHVADDRAALARIQRALAPGGRVVLLAPQYPALFSAYDRMVGHHRRYTRATLARVVRAAGFRLEHLSSFNFAGILGWLVNSRWLGRARLGGAQVRLFDALTPIFRWCETLLPLPGLSLIAVARKPWSARVVASHADAAVHADGGAGDVAGEVGGQPEDGAGDVARLAQAPQRAGGGE